MLCLQHPLRSWGIPDCFAERCDTPRYYFVGDIDPGPDMFKHFVLSHQSIRVLYKIDKDVIDLTLELHWYLSTAEFMALCVEHIVSKDVPHRLLSCP